MNSIKTQLHLGEITLSDAAWAELDGGRIDAALDRHATRWADVEFEYEEDGMGKRPLERVLSFYRCNGVVFGVHTVWCEGLPFTYIFLAEEMGEYIP